jgi:hypothetical protein
MAAPPANAEEQPPPGSQPPSAPPTESLLLISGHRLTLSSDRTVAVSLTCSGPRSCNGKVALTTAGAVRLAHDRKAPLSLGESEFSIPAGQQVTVRVPVSRRKARLARSMKQSKLVVTVTQLDLAGRIRTSTLIVQLRAP